VLAGNKETVGGPVSNEDTFPGAGDFSCPGGQALFLEDVSYTNIMLSGEGRRRTCGAPFPRRGCTSGSELTGLRLEQG
jgi:hypothetical protein